MNVPTQRFVVTIHTWSAHQIEIEAANDDEAIEFAERIYTEDFDQFLHRDGRIDSIHTERLIETE